MKKVNNAVDVLKHLRNASTAQKDLIMKMETVKTKELECDMGFDIGSKVEFNYKGRVFIRNLTTDEQLNLGIGVYYAKIHKTTSSPIHEHEYSSQLIHVKKGTIFDKTSKIMFKEGESFYVSKNNEHSVKYLKGSEVLFVYMPALTT